MSQVQILGEPVAASDASNWYTETQGEGIKMQFRIDSALHCCQTKFQKVEVLQTPAFGRVLMLDGQTQSSQMDEALYHESLVQPAMCAHPQPTRVFIGGGGEGATLREVLKHSSVTRATMCDIDEEVVALCKQHMPTLNKGSFDDPRAEVLFTDAKAYVEQNGPWDIIILDLADPLECGPAFALYTQEFYRTCMDKLTPHGILVTQSGPCDFTTCKDVFTPVNATLRSVFPHVFSYGVYIPSFGHEWGFALVPPHQFESSDHPNVLPFFPFSRRASTAMKLLASRLPPLQSTLQLLNDSLMSTRRCLSTMGR